MSKLETCFAEIDYGYGMAEYWGPFNADTVERDFMHHANQCFGIRKSISKFNLVTLCPEALPAPWAKLPGATRVLKQSGDTIVWGADDEKIKSEWD